MVVGTPDSVEHPGDGRPQRRQAEGQVAVVVEELVHVLADGGLDDLAHARPAPQGADGERDGVGRCPAGTSRSPGTEASPRARRPGRNEGTAPTHDSARRRLHAGRDA